MPSRPRAQLEALGVGRDYAAWFAVRNHRDPRATMPLSQVPEQEIERIRVVEHDPARERQFKHRGYRVHRVAADGTVDTGQLWTGTLRTVCSWEDWEAELRRRDETARAEEESALAAQEAEQRALGVVGRLLPGRDPREVVQRLPFMDKPLVVLDPETLLDLVDAARRDHG